MRTLDLAPLYRATVGFDQMADLMDRVLRDNASAQAGYPPYNIEKAGDDAWNIEIAVAGFAEDVLTVEQRENALIVAAEKTDDDSDRVYLHRGIAARSFERRFHLADHVRVEAARYMNGMLTLELKREVPEALKPRSIAIDAAPKAVEHRVRADPQDAIERENKTRHRQVAAE